MDVFAVDDSAQRKPMRAGMGSLVAAGGVYIPGAHVRALERELADVCREVGFPAGAEFKWSPDKKLWMHKSLTFDRRRDFFLRALDSARQHEATAIVVIEDTTRATATEAPTAEEDVVTLLLERAHNVARQRASEAIVIADRPSGNRKDETRFLQTHINTVNRGTGYATLDRLALVVATDSALTRLVQLADLVVGCTLAYVAGESTWSPPIFEGVKPILRREFGRIGGVGVKLQPDFTYANLYHWLLGDETLWRGSSGVGLPYSGRPYYASPDKP